MLGLNLVMRDSELNIPGWESPDTLKAPFYDWGWKGMNNPCLPFCGWELDFWQGKPRAHTK